MSMLKAKNRVCSFAKSPTSVKHHREIVQRIDRSKISKLNKALEAQLRQNKEERIASMCAAAHYIVGEK